MFGKNLTKKLYFFLAFACLLPSGSIVCVPRKARIQNALQQLQKEAITKKEAKNKKKKTWKAWFTKRIKKAKKFYNDNSFVFKLFAGILGTSLFGWYAIPRLFYNWTTTTIGNSRIGAYKRTCTNQQQVSIGVQENIQAPRHPQLGRVYVNRNNPNQPIYRMENEQGDLIGYQNQEGNVIVQRPENPLPVVDPADVENEQTDQLRQDWAHWRAFVNTTELAQQQGIRRVIYNLPNTNVYQPQVAPQQGDSCAYHAMKNTTLILNEIRNPQGNLNAQLQDRQIVEREIGTPENPGRWRQQFIDSDLNRPARDRAGQPQRNRRGNIIYPNGDPNGENINDAGLELIRDNCDNIPNDIHIITAQTIGHPIADLTCPQVAQELRDAPGEYSAGFVINLGRHWVSAVVHKDAESNINWYTPDSYKNTSRLNSPSINRLIGVVSGQQVAAAE